MQAIIAALPREIDGLVKGISPDAALQDEGIHLYRLPTAIIVAGGMGSDRATLAVQAALRCAQPHTLFSIGLAGACLPSVSPGQVLEADTIIDVNTGERFHAGTSTGQAPLILATSTSIASVQEKARLAESYGAAMVDMEAATVARLARAHGLRFRAVKGISDAHDFELASLSRFEGKHGSFRTGSFALHTALRLHTWHKAIALGRGSSQALAALERELRRLIAAPE